MGGGRRKSQNFTDLCRKFEGSQEGFEQASSIEEIILRSKDTHHSSDVRKTFTSLRDNWDNKKGGKIFKQSQLNIVNGKVSLAGASTNRKRIWLEGMGDKGSAAKRSRNKQGCALVFSLGKLLLLL